MKKKNLNPARKLVLQKKMIGSLIKKDTGTILGGATLIGDTSPCGPCPGPTFACPSIACPPNTNPTVGNPCCANGSIAIDSRCPGIC